MRRTRPGRRLFPLPEGEGQGEGKRSFARHIMSRIQKTRQYFWKKAGGLWKQTARLQLNSGRASGKWSDANRQYKVGLFDLHHDGGDGRLILHFGDRNSAWFP